MFGSHLTPDLPKENGLYISNLEQGVTTELLYSLFRTYGDILYIKAPRNGFTGESRLFAFIYFKTCEQAQRAKREMNYQSVLKKPLIITSIGDYDREAQLYFKGFPHGLSHQEVQDFFSQFAPVVYVKFNLNREDNYMSRGYGWVQFQNVEGKNKVLAQKENLNYQEKKSAQVPNLQTYKIEVDTAQQRQYSDPNFHKNNIYLQSFVKDKPELNQEYTQEQLDGMRNELEKKIPTGLISTQVRMSKAKKPIAFMSFKDKETAESVLKELKEGNLQYPMDEEAKVYANLRNVQPRTGKSYINLQNIKPDVELDTLQGVINEMVKSPKNPESNVQAIHQSFIDTIRDRSRQNTILSKVCLVVFKNDGFARRFWKNCLGHQPFKELFNNDAPFVSYQFINNEKQIFKKRQQQRSVPGRTQQIPFQFMQPPYGFMPPGQGLIRPGPMGPGPMGPGSMGPGPMGPGSIGFLPLPNFLGETLGSLGQYNYQGQPGFVPQIPKTIDIKDIPYNQRPDLREILNNRDAFDSLPQKEQRKKLGQMLLVRVREKLSNISEDYKNRIVGMLIDEESMEISDILEVLEQEDEFKDRLSEALDLIQEEEEDKKKQQKQQQQQ